MPDDATVIVELPIGEKKMPAVDLPENVAAHIQLESVGNIQASNQAGRDLTVTANNILKAAMARNFDELGVVEGRSVSGVMGTPIAGPTNAQKV